MKLLTKTLLLLVLLSLMAFSVFGFLATFEPNPPAWQWMWRAIYIVVFFVCISGIVRLLKR